MAAPLFRTVRVTSGETGTMLPALTDHHVHLDLLEADVLSGCGLAAVVDLGSTPDRLADRRAGVQTPTVQGVGAFLTAPGGYPAGRPWAPPGSVVQLRSGEEAAVAVDRQAAAGAAAIKVTLHAGGPVLDRPVLAAVVAAAHSHRLPVVAHAEGPGMVARALAAGVDALAHTPWTERLADDLLARAAARQVWISTLDIHGYGEGGRAYDTAVDNLRRFAAASGRVLYGTDLGNGPLPVGMNARELAGLVRAGLSVRGVLAAVTDPWPVASPPDDRASFVPGPVPSDAARLPSWLAGARTIEPDEATEVPWS